MSAITSTTDSSSQLPPDNLYAILGVAPTASPAEIRTAYRQRCKECHPDAGGTEEQFYELRTAYMVLSDADKRAKYDVDGTIDEETGVSFENDVVVALASLFEQFLRAGVHTKRDIDIIQAMRETAQDRMRDLQSLIDKSKRVIAQFSDLRSRVKSSDTKNLFQGMLDSKIDEFSRLEKKNEYEYRVWSAAMQELRAYTCVTDVIERASIFNTFGFSQASGFAKDPRDFFSWVDTSNTSNTTT